MERRSFVRSSLTAAATFAVGNSVFGAGKKAENKEFYEFREYHVRFGSSQAALHNYFEKALIPAFNKHGIKNIGVFRETGKTEPPKFYLLIPYPSFDEYVGINAKVKADSDYLKNSSEYNSIPQNNALYSRIKTSFMVAFDGLPAMVVPAKEPRIFELRTYEGYSEDAVRRKIKMFNESEFTIFNRVKLNPVFFGEVIAGDNLPCLTYMITFRNMEERDANWRAFGADPDWKKVSADPQYANTVSNIIRIFLEPMAYSQV